MWRLQARCIAASVFLLFSACDATVPTGAGGGAEREAPVNVRPGTVEQSVMAAAEHSAPFGAYQHLRIGVLEQGKTATSRIVSYLTDAREEKYLFHLEDGTWKRGPRMEARQLAGPPLARGSMAPSATASSTMSYPHAIALTRTYTGGVVDNWYMPHSSAGLYSDIHLYSGNYSDSPAYAWFYPGSITTADGNTHSVSFVSWWFWTSETTLAGYCDTPACDTHRSYYHPSFGTQIHPANKLQLYYNYSISPAPPSVYINGPDYVDTGATYTWEAVASGGDGSYTYQWEFSQDGGISWSWVGSSQTYSSYISPGQTNFNLRVTVVSRGAGNTAYKYVNTPHCGGPNIC